MNLSIYMIFAGCSIISIVLWVCNWVCWLRECCCFRAFDPYSNKIFVWWLSFIFLTGIIACCIAGFVTANRFGFCSYAVQCAYERVYYDTLNGQIKNTYPKWEGIDKIQENLNGLDYVYNNISLSLNGLVFEKQEGYCSLIYPVPTSVVDGLCRLDDNIKNQINQKLFDGITSLYNLKKIKDLHQNSDKTYRNELENIKTGLEEYKNKFIEDFEYYVHVARGLGQILPLIYFSILLTTVVAALTLLIIFFCNCIECWNQEYYILPMHIIWNIIRFFIFSFFMYGCGYGMFFLLARDEIRFLKYILEEQNGSNAVIISEKTVNFFNYCLKGNNMFEEVYQNTFPDEFIGNTIKFETWKNNGSSYSGEGSEIYKEYKDALIGAYNVIDQDSLSMYQNIYKNTGSVYSILKCDFIQNNFNLLYNALWDLSWESRILCTLSCFIGFLGVIGVYGFLWTMNIWRRDDNGGYRYVRNNEVGDEARSRDRGEVDRPEEKVNLKSLKKRFIRPPNIKNDDMDDDNNNNNNNNNNNEQEMNEKNNEDEDELS